VTSQLKLISEERDRLVEQKAGDERQIGELERSVLDFKSKVSRLGEMAAELGRPRRELSDTTNALAVATEESQRLKENVQSLKGKLDATDIAKNTLELELATTRELVYGQNEQIDELTGGLEAARAELATARAALTRQEVDIKNLVQSNERAGREMKTLKARIESLQEELDLNTQALREIRTATLRTTARVLEQGPGA
jgi:chromosome segregation ATPase